MNSINPLQILSTNILRPVQATQSDASSLISSNMSEPALSPAKSSYTPEFSPCLPLTCLTWNIEGIKRNLYSLKSFTELTKPDLIFLSEPQIFFSDLAYCMSLFQGEYNSELNSEDKYNSETAMIKSKSAGGTMVLWKKSLDCYISVFPVNCTSFLPVVFSPPGSPVSVHIALYLPTSGREDDFINSIIDLNNCIADLTDKYGDECLIFLRGDANVNHNNHDRMKVFSNFLASHNLIHVPISHKTYHHFLGGGAFDSNIDIICHSKASSFK